MLYYNKLHYNILYYNVLQHDIVCYTNYYKEALGGLRVLARWSVMVYDIAQYSRTLFGQAD